MGTTGGRVFTYHYHLPLTTYHPNETPASNLQYPLGGLPVAGSPTTKFTASCSHGLAGSWGLAEDDLSLGPSVTGHRSIDVEHTRRMMTVCVLYAITQRQSATAGIAPTALSG